MTSEGLTFSRRSFLKGVLALSVAPALPAVAIAIPVIYGDGVNCDTDGLQALFDRKPFRVNEGAFVARNGTLWDGFFRITRTLVLRRDKPFILQGCTFDLSDIPIGTYGIMIAGAGEDSFIRYCRFIAPGAKAALWD